MQKQRGVSNLILVIIIVAVAIVAVGGVLVYQNFATKTQPVVQTQQNQNQNNQTAQPSITVTSPNGGETWTKGQTYNITWNATGVQAVNITLNYGASAMDTIASNIPALNGSYSWTIPTNFTNHPQAWVVINSSSSNSVADYSNNPFSIVAPTANQTAGWKTYSNTQYGYSIKYPSDWSYETFNNRLTIFCDYSKRSTCQGLGDKNPNTAGSVFIDINQGSIEDLKKDWTIEKQENYLLDGVSGIKVVGSVATDMGEAYLNSIFVTKNNNNYRIGASTITPILYNIISTFKFTN